jgi:flagellar hook-associated protein 2
VNAQQGLDSSGNAEPLFGSPTLSLLQQQLLNGLNTQNPSGYLDPISSSASTALSGSFTVNVGNGTTQTIVIGSAPANPPADTFYTGSGSGYNTLAGLASAINAAASGTALTYSGTDGTDTVASSGTLTSLPDANDQLNGSISIQVGSGTAQNIVIGAAPASGAPDNTLYTGDGVNTLSGLADFINANLGVQAVVNTPPGGVSTLSLTSGTLGSAGTLTVNSSLVAAGIGFRASVVTNGGQSTLSLLSGTAGSSGVLTVNSQIAATSGTPLSYSGTAGSSTQTSIGTLTSIANATPVHTLAGSISIAVGSGQAQTITIDSTDNTLSGLADAINKASIGVQASVVTDPNNSSNSSLQLVSNTPGSAGTLAVTSNIADMTSAATATLSYTNSSDISTLANLGITVSNKYDGSISFDATMLSSALNSDYSSVLGFFQNVNSWGQTFSTMLESAGTSSSKGMLSLAQSSNSSIESVLNRDISNEESMISIQQKSLTAELNSANEILQMLPTQLEGVNQLYSAITGYNQNK